MNQTNNFKGYLGFSLRELNQTEVMDFCYSNISNLSVIQSSENVKAKLLKVKQLVNFTANFGLRIYSSGCYYLDPETGLWSSYGLEILSDSNITHTHCVSSHLTSFAGGYIVLPAAINFDSVWSKASFLDNPTIYITIIVITCLFVILLIWSVRKDYLDKKKIGFTLIKTNENNNYLYEVILFTGNRPNSGTDSLVFFYFSRVY